MAVRLKASTPPGADPNRDYQKEKERYAYWKALSPEARAENGFPKTQKDYAEQYNLSERVLTKWNSDPLVERVVSTLQRNIVKEAVPQILMALVERAKKGEYKHIELSLQIAGFLDDLKKEAEDNEQREMFDLTDEEIEQEINRILAETSPPSPS